MAALSSRALRLGLACALGAGAASAQAQGGSLADQAVTLTLPNTHWGPIPSADLAGTEPNPALDILVQSGWWYRVQGVSTREHPLPAPSSSTWQENLAVFWWEDLAGIAGLDLTLRVRVIDNEDPSGTLAYEVRVVNGSGQPLTLHMFHYLDVDLEGSAGDDVLAVQQPGFLKLSDASAAGAVGRYRAHEAIKYKAGTPTAVKALLNNFVVDDLDDCCAVAAPSDVAAAFQWSGHFEPAPSSYPLAAAVQFSSRLRQDLFEAELGPYPFTGFPSILWRSPLGEACQWLMRRTALVQTTCWAAGPDPDRRFVAAEDFDGDLTAERLYRHQVTGQLYFDATPLSGGVAPPLNWLVAATADFNADGQPDILWRNSTSNKLVIWTMNGTAKLGNIIPSPDAAVDGNWQVVGAADADGNATPDLIWYNTSSGKVVQWLMNASVARTSGRFTTPANAGDANWKVVASGDWGRGGGPPGTTDLLWRNATSGNLVVWHMDWNGVRQAGVFTTPGQLPAGSELVGPR